MTPKCGLSHEVELPWTVGKSCLHAAPALASGPHAGQPRAVPKGSHQQGQAGPGRQNAESQVSVTPRSIAASGRECVLRNMGPEGHVGISDKLRGKADGSVFLLSG